MPDTPDPVAAALDGIRERCNRWHDAARSPAVDFGDWVTSIEASAEDTPVLLRAVDSALELADRWDAVSAAITGQLAALGAPIPPDADPGNPRARELREAITAALAGKEAGDARE
jgi:hypothetical protein